MTMDRPADRHFDVLIIGAGHAGSACAIALRQGGFAGSIGLADAQDEPPYERPPLSKDYLAGERPFERLMIRPDAFWTERQVTLLPATRIVQVDAQARTVGTEGGDRIGYGSLVWAAGGRARRWPMQRQPLSNLFVIRTREDVDGIRAHLPACAHIAIVGGGYVGLEAAAVLRGRGKAVTLIEAQDRILSRVAGPALSHHFAALHRAHGVDLRCDVQVDAIEKEGGRATGLVLDDGSLVPAEMLIVGIGIDPVAEPLLAAGAQGSGGVDVDAQCRTSLPDILAIGDVARHADPHAGGRWIRLESVQNASDMARIAAQTLLGVEAVYDALPWFWSHQYDVRLQTVGLSDGHDEELVRGDPASGSFSVLYRREGAVIALDCVNAARDYVQGRALILSGTRIEAACLTDPAIPLKSLA